MQIAVVEVVAAGMLGCEPPTSLLREGLAMWRGLVTDLCAVPGISVDTVLVRRWQEHRPDADALHAWLIDDVAEAALCIDSAIAESDAAILIAPETDGLLSQLVSRLSVSQRRFLSSPAAIDLCGDKYRLAIHLSQHDIATIPTQLADADEPPCQFPCVVKLRDGAGSQAMQRLDTPRDWQRWRRHQTHGTHICQPYIAGRSFSIAGWIASAGEIDWLPVAEQWLSDDGRFEYRGGRLPAELNADQETAMRTLATRAVQSVPGLRGYIGCDLLWPTEASQPLLVEINPRFTTSYVGYRAAWTNSPWPRWLSDSLLSDKVGTGIQATRTVQFTADGEITIVGRQ